MRYLLIFLSAGLLAHTATATPAAGIAQRIERAPAGQVNIYRDRYGQPHLYAQRQEDAYFGLGYALGEDRLPQVLLSYVALRGELAAAFGPGELGTKPGIAGMKPVGIDDTVASDIETRRWRYLADARANLARISPQRRKNVTAFVAGLARYMADHPDRVPAWAPPLEPALPLAAEASLMLANNGAPGSCGAKTEPAVLKGSNIWAVTAGRTTDKAAIFSSDSHSGIEYMGSVFHAARISSDGVDGWMLDLTGMPMSLKGHSRHFAWGWAEGPRFPGDCVRMETSAADPNAYLYDGRRVAMKVERYSIAVRGAAPVTGTFEYSRHNGVLSPIVRREGTIAYAISSAYMGRQGLAGDAFAAMQAARTWPEMRAALERREIYPANLIIAGDDGSIFYVRPGRLPIRPDGADPTRDVDGNRSASAWRGIRPLDALLQYKDPPEGYLTNENVSPDRMFSRPHFDPAAYPKDYAFEPGLTGTRQLRAINLLEAPRKLSFADALAVVGDAAVPGYERWSTALRQAIGTSEIAVDERRTADAVIGFDGHFVPRSTGALAHAIWRFALRRDESAPRLSIERKVMKGERLSPVEDAALRTALADAAKTIRAYPAGFDTVFGDIFRIGRGGTDAPARGLTLYSIGDDETGLSDFGSLWASVYQPEPGTGRYRDTSGTRWPFVVQFTQPIRSYSMSAYGQSDDPESPHFSDQAALFGAAALHSTYFEPAELAHEPTRLQTLDTGLRR